MPNPNNQGGPGNGDDGESDEPEKILEFPWPYDVRVVNGDKSEGSSVDNEKLDVEVTGYTSSSETGSGSSHGSEEPPRMKTGMVYGPDGVGHPTKPLDLPDDDKTEE